MKFEIKVMYLARGSVRQAAPGFREEKARRSRPVPKISAPPPLPTRPAIRSSEERMRSPGEIWRQRAWVVGRRPWSSSWPTPRRTPSTASASPTVWRSLRQDLKDERERLDPLEARQKKLEELLARSASNEQEIRRLYAESFATRRQRLTRSPPR